MPSRTCSSAIAAGGGWFGRLLLAAQSQIGLVTAIDGRIDRIVDNFSVAPYRVIGLLELAGPAGVGIGLAYIRLGAAAAAGLILLLTGSSSSGACPTRRLVRPRFVVPEAVAAAQRVSPGVRERLQVSIFAVSATTPVRLVASET